MDRREALGPYTLRQTSEVFPLCGDTLALGGFAGVRRGDRVCDLGCGSGALALLLLARESTLHVTGVEISPAAAALARENFAANAVPGEVVEGDLRQVKALLPAGAFSLAVSNPPYFPAGSGGSGGPARMEEHCTLEQLCAAAAWLLKNGGRFALVHRPERLADLMCALRAHALEPKRMQLLVPDHGRPPAAVLLEAIKQGRPGLSVLPEQRI